MEVVDRKSINDDLTKYDYLAKKDDFISVTEWTNHEGVDITIGDNQLISLSYGTLDAIDYLVKTLKYKE